jgi:PTS system beta-glucosides-specific IIC component
LYRKKENTMGLFDAFSKKKEATIASPVKGRLVDVTEVSDETFSTEILGTTVAVIPEEGRFYAPASGKIVTLFPTLHALAIEKPEGVEVLLHIGLDTVKLNGKYFVAHCAEGDTIKQGQLLMEVNLDAVKSEGYDVITPIVICNTADMKAVNKEPAGNVAPGDPVMKVAVN